MITPGKVTNCVICERGMHCPITQENPDWVLYGRMLEEITRDDMALARKEKFVTDENGKRFKLVAM
jgi:hypothetical protein